MRKIILNLSASLIMVSSFATVISCASKKLETKKINKGTDPINETSNVKNKILSNENDFSLIENKGTSEMNRILSNDAYNHQYNILIKEHNKNKVAIIVIANKKAYVNNVMVHKGETLFDKMSNLDNIQFRYHNTPGLGAFINSFRCKKNDTWGDWSHGMARLKNYGDWYPLIWWNHKYSLLGASSLHVKAGDIYEISYDINM